MNRQTQPIQIAIILLTIATAAIHLRQALITPSMRLILTLNGLGYLGLLAALYLPIAPLRPWRLWTRRILIIYAAITITLYVAGSIMEGLWLPIGIIDKVIEVLLIALLIYEGKQPDSSAG